MLTSRNRHHLLQCRVIPGLTRGEYDALRDEQVSLYCGLCAYCSGKLPVDVSELGRTERTRGTLDHIDSRANGGSHDRDNLAPACYSCNSRKSDRPLIVFLAMFSDRLGRKKR